MINRKAKGTKGERELVTFFNESKWCCIRVAGSGSTKYPSPDILAGNGIRRLAIECKVTKEKKKYFTKNEIDQLVIFSKTFGAESWVSIRFPDEPWYFLMLEDLKDAGKSFVVTLDLAKMKGLKKEELIQS
tara:strand:+ start:945 stop:1337 length:393 start_codon:yes stop_codon:yes gene_type:complete